MPPNKGYSITTFRRAYETFENNLRELILDEPLSGQSLEKSLHPIFKALGIMEKDNSLTPIGNLLKKRYRELNNIDYSILRMQIVYYRQYDFKPLPLDILKFIFDNSKVNNDDLETFLITNSYDLGGNTLQSIQYFLPYLLNVGYLELQEIKEIKEIKYFIPDNVKKHVFRLINSYIYNVNFNPQLYDKFLVYYKSDRILDKILFFTYGVENG